MSRNTARYLLIFSLALNIGFLVLFLAQQFRDGPPLHRGSPRELADQVIKGLDLPGEQQEAMRALEASFEEQLRQMGRTVGAERLKVLELMADPGPLDEAALRAQEKVLQDLVRERFDMFLEHAGKMEEIIGPEKRAAFHAALLARIRQDRPEPRGGE